MALNLSKGGGQVAVNVLATASKHGEVEAQRIPGLRLRDATDAALERLKALTALRGLDRPQESLTGAS